LLTSRGTAQKLGCEYRNPDPHQRIALANDEEELPPYLENLVLNFDDFFGLRRNFSSRAIEANFGLTFRNHWRLHFQNK